MLSGRPEWIARIRSNPLFRALRVDKLTYAALEATLLEYLRGNYDAIPTLRMMRISAQELRARAEALTTAGSSKLRMAVEASESIIGGGTAPTATLPTFVIALTHADLSADELSARLRMHEPVIVGRVQEGKVLLDLRTVLAEEDATIAYALKAI
jgi:L-seryl-tRNA(Ser) seleniumtransferase